MIPNRQPPQSATGNFPESVVERPPRADTGATAQAAAPSPPGSTQSGLLRALLFLFWLAAFGPVPSARAQTATLVSSLVATQGETITYTVIITNQTGVDLTNVVFSDLLSPYTTFVEGSLNSSPLALADAYAALGNVQLTVPAPGVLANDVDVDGVGPALTALPGTFTSTNGGNVVLNADGGFTYNPPRGFEGQDTFTYTNSDGEGFTGTGTATITVTGMIWFVNAAAAAGGDGRLTAPYNTLAAFATVNNGAGNNPATNDNIFVYSGNYTGGLALLNGQKLIGQGATAGLATIAGVSVPPGSTALPATGGTRPALGGATGVTLASGNLVRGLNLNHSGGTSLLGGSVGSLSVSEASITNSAGAAVNLSSGSINVAIGSLISTGGLNGIRLVNCAGSFTVSGDGNPARNGTGGTIQNSTGDGVYLSGVVNVSLLRMNLNNSAGNGVFGQNVNGLVVDWCSLNNNGDAANEDGIRLGDPIGAVNGLTGTAPAGANPTRIANTLVAASGEMNVAIFNNGGTLAQLDVTNVLSRDTRTRPLGADGFYFETRGSAVATVNFANCSFTNNFTQGLQALALAQSALTINVTNCGFTNNNEGLVLENANDADLTFDVNNSKFFNSLPTGASGAAIAVVNATTVTAGSIYSGKVRNNLILGGGIDNHLITALFSGAGLSTLQVANNNVNAVNSQFSGIFVQAGETGSGNLAANVTVTNNTVSLGALGSHGMVIQSRITSTLCAEIGGNVSTTGGVGLFGLNVRQRDTSTFRLPNFAGPYNSTATVISFLQGKNVGTTVGATVATAYAGGAACSVPLLTQPAAEYGTGLGSPAGPARINPNAANSAVKPDSASGTVEPRVLTAETLEPIVCAARQLWMDSGLTREQVAILDSLRFEVTDLTGWYLGASSARLVQLDRRANRYGWFIEPAPMQLREIARASRQTPREGIDLLTAVLHEMGHQLGLPDDYTAPARKNVMYGFLVPGERRLPVRGQARDARPETGLDPHYLFTPVNIGTLPVGKAVTLTFRVTIANATPPGVFAITNQGIVTADGGWSALTDDPRTVPALDATLTGLLVAPIVTTQPASGIAGSAANLNGLVNPCSSATGYYFQYGTNLAYGSVSAPGALAAGFNVLPVAAFVSGLQAGNTYHFRLVATNAYGTSFGGDLTFATPLSLNSQPASVAACVGSTVSFTVGVDTTGLNYQWQARAPGAGGFTNIPGATAVSYMLPAVSAAGDGTRLRVIVSAPNTNLTSAEAVLSVLSVTTPAASYDFNTGLPPNTAIYGNAYFNAGVLELNPNTGGQNGAFLTTDFAPGRFVRGFTATFKVRMQAGTAPPADGFSFNWATDLPNGIYATAEEGQGSGLTVAFDTFDNGFGEAPAIDVLWNSNVVVHLPVDAAFLVRGAIFVDVRIRLSADGLLDLTYGCDSVVTQLPIPGYVPQKGARFGLGSRTGGLWETHGIDDLALELYLDPTNGRPRFVSAVPQGGGLLIQGTGASNQNYAVEVSSDLVSWVWRTNVTTDASGAWQFLEAGFAASARGFYRLQAAPQFPSGLLDWWPANGDYQDNFGPYDATPLNGASLAAGQRGQAFNFNGINQGLSLSGAPIPVPWTACFWVNRADATDPSAALISDGVSALKLEQPNGARQVGFTRFGVLDYYFTYVTPTNTWTHLAFVATPTGTILYTNGVAAGTNAATVPLPRTFLGMRSVAADRMRGLLDEITLFNRALTPAEIQQELNATRGP